MRLRLFTPAQGWSGFLTELAIVVLGVLIALGAQQAVDGWNRRSDVTDFRAALNVELAINLGAYHARIVQSRCLSQRLDQLDSIPRQWREYKAPAIPENFGRPLPYSLNLSVWRSGLNGLSARMPLQQQLTYAVIYDELQNYDVLRLREIAVWQQLFAYDGAVQLSPIEINSLRGLLLAARATDEAMSSNWPFIVGASAKLGVRPQDNPGLMTRNTELCTSMDLQAPR